MRRWEKSSQLKKCEAFRVISYFDLLTDIPKCPTTTSVRSVLGQMARGWNFDPDPVAFVPEATANSVSRSQIGTD